MSAEFMWEYLKQKEERKKRMIYQMNPNKIRTCEWLVREHEKRGDKIIVFSDSLMSLHHYSGLLKRRYPA